MLKTRIKVLAIDPGTKEMGFSHLEDLDLIDFGVKSIGRGKGPDEMLNHVERIVSRLVLEKRPTVMAVEKNNFSQQKQNTRLTWAVAKIRTVAKRNRIPVFEYDPRTIRKAVCNDGNAKKRDVAKTIVAIYPETRAFLDMNCRNRELFFQNGFDAIACGLTFLKRNPDIGPRFKFLWFPARYSDHRARR